MMSNVASVLPELNSGDQYGDMVIADLLNILSYAGDASPSYKDLIARYLYGPGVWSAIMALSVLCYFYKLTTNYAQEISQLMRGVRWDPEYNAQEFATGVAATFLRKESDPILLRTLIDIVEDRTIPEEPRTNAQSALVAALGLNDVNGVQKESRGEGSLLRLAKERLKQEL